MESRRWQLLQSEIEAKTIIETAISAFTESRVVIGKAEQGAKSSMREVTFFIIVPTSIDITALSKTLTEMSLDNELLLAFTGYDHGMLHGDMESYFFFVKAKINQKIRG